MRGSIWSVVALVAGLALLPPILDIDVSGDETGEAIMTVLSPFGEILGVFVLVAVGGLLVSFYLSDGGF